MNFDTSSMEKILESQYLRFIDTTPTAQNPTWKVIGIGVEEGNAGVEYNPDIERIKWIIDNAARSNHKSNDKQMSVPQKTYKGDPCFEFVNAGRDKLNYVTHLLEVDMWDKNGSAYSSKMSDATVSITSYNGDEIDWDLYIDGDPTEGTVAVAGTVPTFTPTASL